MQRKFYRRVSAVKRRLAAAATIAASTFTPAIIRAAPAAVAGFAAMLALPADAQDDYPAHLKNAPQDSLVDPWGFYNRECVSSVAYWLSTRNGFTIPYAFGNATNWGTNASGRWPISRTPAIGAIAWWSNGHVAWVYGISSDGSQAYIDEYNYLYRGEYDTRTISAGSPTGYIHFKDIAVAPSGYSYITNEGNSTYFSTPVDVAFGSYPYFVKDEDYWGSTTFSTGRFGDPDPGVPKFGFYKPFTKGANEGGSNYFDTPVTACYGANGRYYIYYAVAGTVTFSDNVWGDPNPGVAKAGYYMPFTKYANEGQSAYIPSSGYVAYGAQGKYYYRYVAAGWVTFNNNTWGDPSPGVAKGGYFRPLGLCH